MDDYRFMSAEVKEPGGFAYYSIWEWLTDKSMGDGDGVFLPDGQKIENKDWRRFVAATGYDWSARSQYEVYKVAENIVSTGIRLGIFRADTSCHRWLLEAPNPFEGSEFIDPFDV